MLFNNSTVADILHGKKAFMLKFIGQISREIITECFH